MSRPAPVLRSISASCWLVYCRDYPISLATSETLSGGPVLYRPLRTIVSLRPSLPMSVSSSPRCCGVSLLLSASTESKKSWAQPPCKSLPPSNPGNAKRRLRSPVGLAPGSSDGAAVSVGVYMRAKKRRQTPGGIARVRCRVQYTTRGPSCAIACLLNV